MTSSRADGLFSGTFSRGGAAAEVSDSGWLAAMLDAEAALAAAQAELGLIPAGAAEAVAKACDPGLYDLAELGHRAGPAGNPVIPLVAALRERVEPGLRRYVHHGATSQDVNDTAAMLVACRALVPILADLAASAEACARLAAEHRGTLMAGRTVLQHAVPITFGLKAAGWLSALDRARELLTGLDLPVQYGGAAGTLSVLGGRGHEVLPLLAAELELAEPLLPWHTDRTPVAELACALGVASGVLGKIATDVKLLAQTEVGEAAEPQAPGRGGSSAMPHKRNPVGAMSVLACVQRVPGLVASVLGGMAQEHERAAGPWQAEWETLGELLRLTGSAAAWLGEVLEGLTVDAARMRANLGTTRGLLMAERAVAVLGGSPEARAAVDAACARAVADGLSLREALLATPGAELEPEELDAALDPAGHLGSAGVFVDRVLGRAGGEG
ncbi:3-carboxy-cis,cis-muconate cycloisomerase [Planomonospora venezuelensis]|uniref:3-carboxy-cis,cis-muconate cycloisomerase n=1 Tax=Planomonospora venezuelensis TaxID=1999 RepID=A0A841D434_PLAVE|nr:3-carboxy-cis,cis-muconate cycloisomerase [Planomonospora venezuelensis]MBB5963148.1 3-carboxy-cis,cis-muconate cycloisomerase [Planomonospora venezuelensis]GIN00023.1 3-carboxy-cis,cis-muconate cycloisomerase [Planomonospora venezuelensis]